MLKVYEKKKNKKKTKHTHTHTHTFAENTEYWQNRASAGDAQRGDDRTVKE